MSSHARARTRGRLGSAWARLLPLALIVAALALIPALTGTAAAAGPQITLSPASGPAGTVITIQGSGFTRGQGQVFWNGNASGMPSVRTGRDGSFSVKATAPAQAAGSYTVSVTVNGVSAAAPFQLQAVTTATPSGTAPPPPSSSVYLGVWQPPGPWDMSQLSVFERDAGKNAAIVHFYIGWSDNQPPDTNLLATVANHGSVAMISWSPWDWKDPNGRSQPTYSLANIAAGNFDPYVRTWARTLAAYKGPVLLRWAHEMNTGEKYPWTMGINGNTPERYVAAWRRLHDIFVAEGATNVQWVWSPNIDWDGQHGFEPMFPGDSYVDWVGLDGYNNVEWGGWKTFTQVFGPSYQRITALSAKPLMIAETGSGETGGNKAAWITDALAVQIPTNFPRVRALVWFNENFEGVDWRIESSSTARTAFATAVASPLYRGTWK